MQLARKKNKQTKSHCSESYFLTLKKYYHISIYLLLVVFYLQWRFELCRSGNIVTGEQSSVTVWNYAFFISDYKQYLIW